MTAIVLGRITMHHSFTFDQSFIDFSLGSTHSSIISNGLFHGIFLSYVINMATNCYNYYIIFNLNNFNGYSLARIGWEP